MAKQHEQVADATNAVEAALSLWRSDASTGPGVLIETFECLLPVLTRHLDEEERQIVPLIERRMTPQEYGLMATSGNGRYDERTLMMTFGAIVEQCSPQDASYMISHLPQPIQDSWYSHGLTDHSALMRLLREDLKPIAFRPQAASRIAVV